MGIKYVILLRLVKEKMNIAKIKKQTAVFFKKPS